MRRPLLVLLTAGLVVALAACSSDFRTLRPPPPGATAPPRSTSSTAGVSTTTEVTFSLSSSAITAESRIPTEFTCDGAGTSPPVSFFGAPTGTKQLAFLVIDTDHDDEVQWLVTGMPPSLLGITKGAAPVGGTQVVPWRPPCPTDGTSHSYEFQLLALPVAVDPSTTLSSDLAVTVRKLQQQASQKAAFTASFQR